MTASNVCVGPLSKSLLMSGLVSMASGVSVLRIYVSANRRDSCESTPEGGYLVSKGVVVGWCA